MSYFLTTETGAIVHVNQPKVDNRIAQIVDCPDCKKTSLHLVFCYEWDGPDRTCIRCGRRWSDGEWMPLDFYRYARRDNVRAAKKHWRSITRSQHETNQS